MTTSYQEKIIIMQTALLKEYVSKAKDLELSCYEQKLLCDNLEQKLSHINYQRKNKENEKKNSRNLVGLII